MIEIILALLVGIWIGKTVTNAWNHLTFREILKDLGVSQQDLRRILRDKELALEPGRDGPEIVEIKLEQHQGQIYAYRKDDDTFLGQGSDTQSLIARLNETLKPCRVIVHKEDGAELLKNG